MLFDARRRLARDARRADLRRRAWRRAPRAHPPPRRASGARRAASRRAAGPGDSVHRERRADHLSLTLSLPPRLHVARATGFDVAQHLRPSLPRDHLGREPRGRDRLRGRWLSAENSDHRGGDPSLSRQAPAGAVALHHAAARAGHGENSLRRVRGRDDRRAGDDRHADLARDRERRPALEGLFGDPRELSARPRRLHLRDEIRHPRLSRRRALVGARDGDARRRRRDRAKGRAGTFRARRADPDRRDRDRPRALGLERGRQKSLLLARRRDGEEVGALSRRHPEGGLVGRRGDRGRGRRRAGGPRRADLRQARPGHRRRR